MISRVTRIPRLGISLGDPAGIGPEIVARTLAERSSHEVTVFGDAGVLTRAARTVGVTVPAHVAIEEVTCLAADEVTPGRPTDVSGRAQVAFLAAATKAGLAGEVRALVTAPISKEWAGRAGFQFPGHTEYLAA